MWKCFTAKYLHEGILFRTSGPRVCPQALDCSRVINLFIRKPMTSTPATAVRSPGLQDWVHSCWNITNFRKAPHCHHRKKQGSPPSPVSDKFPLWRLHLLTVMWYWCCARSWVPCYLQNGKIFQVLSEQPATRVLRWRFRRALLEGLHRAPWVGGKDSGELHGLSQPSLTWLQGGLPSPVHNSPSAQGWAATRTPEPGLLRGGHPRSPGLRALSAGGPCRQGSGHGLRRTTASAGG